MLQASADNGKMRAACRKGVNFWVYGGQLVMPVFEAITDQAISPCAEMGAYEYLWAEKTGSLSTLAKYLEHENKPRPSLVVPADRATELFQEALEVLKRSGIVHFGTRVVGTVDFPLSLSDDSTPVPFLYFLGYWDLVYSPMKVAVIGTRNPSPDGLKRTEKLVRWLVDRDVTIVSGLARGIDTMAHKTAISQNGNTIGVLGTPISSFYPLENEELQREIAKNHLLISHVPIIKHSRNLNPKFNRGFFTERNRVMSAISDASIIVEAGETSGTRTQASAALQQGRKLLILDNVFERGLTWPQDLVEKGAIRIKNIEQLEEALFVTTEN